MNDKKPVAKKTAAAQAAYDERVAGQSSASAPKAKRTMLSPAEKAAKLRKEAEALEAQAKADAERKAADAKTKRTSLVERRDALNAKIAELDSVIAAASDQPTEG